MWSDLVVRGGQGTPLAHELALPADKSISHRALVLATTIPGATRIENLNRSVSVTVLFEAIRRLGVEVRDDGSAVCIGTLCDPPAVPPLLNFGNSSTAARLLLGHLAGLGIAAVFDGDESLRRRPMAWVVDPLRELGATIAYLERPGFFPLRLERSQLRSGAVTMQVGSAQERSAILLAAAAAQITVDIAYPVRSRDHTERMLRELGTPVEARAGSLRVTGAPSRALDRIVVPRDPSALAFPAAAHVLARRGDELAFPGVCVNPTRTGFIELLRRMGVVVRITDVVDQLGEPVGTVAIGSPTTRLAPFEIADAEVFHALVDEVPIAFGLATSADGRSSLHGGRELMFKETNRLETMRAMLAAFGARIAIDGDRATIEPGALRSSVVPSFGDHRIAMAAAALATSLEGTSTVEQGGCYATSFPGFVEMFRSRGWDVEERA